MQFTTPTFNDAEAEAADSAVPVTTHFCWARINRGPMEMPLVQVRAHELPILKAIHGDPNVQRSDNAPEAEDFHELDAMAEYVRLENYYGLATKDQSFVELVYGRFDEGRFVRELEALAQPPKRRTRKATADSDETIALA